MIDMSNMEDLLQEIYLEKENYSYDLFKLTQKKHELKQELRHIAEDDDGSAIEKEIKFLEKEINDLEKAWDDTLSGYYDDIEEEIRHEPVEPEDILKFHEEYDDEINWEDYVFYNEEQLAEYIDDWISETLKNAELDNLYHYFDRKRYLSDWEMDLTSYEIGDVTYYAT